MNDDIVTQVPGGVFMLYCDVCYATQPHELTLGVGDTTRTRNSPSIRGGRFIKIPVYGYMTCILCKTINTGVEND